MLWWSTRDCPGDRHGRTRGRARYGTCHPGYAVSGRVRKCIQEMGIEEVFGWSKATGGLVVAKMRSGDHPEQCKRDARPVRVTSLQGDRRVGGERGHR